MTANEIATFLGVFVAGLIAGLIGLLSKKKPGAPDAAAIATIGGELGNRLQTDEMIVQLKRIADALEAKEREALEDTQEEFEANLNKELDKRFALLLGRLPDEPKR